MRRSGPHPRPLYFYLNQPNPTGRCSPRWITLRPRSFHSRTSNRSITAIRIKCKCLRTSATRVLCKSTAPLVITEWKLMSSFVTNGPRKWTRTTIQERKEKETSKRDYLIKEEEEYNNASTSKLSKTDWLIDWLLYPTCSFENLIVSLKHLVKEGVKRGEEEHRIRGVALEGVLGFNSLTKLQKTHGCFYFSRVDLWFVGAAATIFIRLERSKNTGALLLLEIGFLDFELLTSIFYFIPIRGNPVMDKPISFGNREWRNDGKKKELDENLFEILD